MLQRKLQGKCHNCPLRLLNTCVRWWRHSISGVFKSWILVPHSPSQRNWRVPCNYSIHVLEQFDMIFYEIGLCLNESFLRSRWPDVLLVREFQTWSLRYKRTNCQWSHGRKAGFCGIWSTISVKTFNSIFGFTYFCTIYPKYGLLCAVLRCFAGSCHDPRITVDSLWPWILPEIVLVCCWLYLWGNIYHGPW